MVYIIPNFSVLHFGEKFMKMGTKIGKLQIHENLHKNVNENMFSFIFVCKFSEFYEGQSKQQICYSFLLLISIYLKWRSSINSSNFDGPNAFFPNPTVPWSQFQKGRKTPVADSLY